MLFFIQLMEVLLPLLYGTSFALYLRHFLQKHSPQNKFRERYAFYGSLGLHILYLIIRSIEFHHFPVSSRAEFLSVVALCIGLVYSFGEMRTKDSQTGPFFISIVFLFQLLASVLMEATTQHPLLHENPVYGVHVIFTVFGFAALAVSALYALMYIMLSRQLKSRHLGRLFDRLPPLFTLESMGQLATLCGIILLGIGLVTGHFVGFYILESFNLLDPKILITDIVWLIYVIAFAVVRWRGLSGLRMAYLALFGYLAFIASMVTANALFQTFHSFS